MIGIPKYHLQLSSNYPLCYPSENIWMFGPLNQKQHSHVFRCNFSRSSFILPSNFPTIGRNLQMARTAWLRTAERSSGANRCRCCWRFFAVLLGLPELGGQNQSHMDFWCKFGPQLLVHWWLGFLGSPFFVKKHATLGVSLPSHQATHEHINH